MTGARPGPAAYEVTSGSDVARALGCVAAWVAVVGLVAGLVGHHWWPAPVVLVVGAVWWVPSVRAARTRLAVGRDGVRVSAPVGWRQAVTARSMTAFETRSVAWPDVHHVEVDAAHERVCVVLRAEARLPAWLRGRIVDVDDPESGPRLERVVPGLDPVALDQAVRAVSPSTPVRAR